MIDDVDLEKKVCFDQLRLQGAVIGIHADGTHEDFQGPPHLKDQLDITLNFNHERGRGDLFTDDGGVFETLRFKGVWVEVTVPWEAVFGIFDNAEPKTAAMWVDDIPEGLAPALEQPEPQKAAAPGEVVPVPAVPKVVPPPVPKPIKKGHLTLVVDNTKNKP